jgi:lycopene cyclase domain-containing protein
VTYFAFHLLFILPPIAALALWLRPRWSRLPSRSARSLPLMALIALVYTTPWDNHLVKSGVWSYGADRVIGTIGYVPVEEYLFFLLQPFLTGLWLYFLVARSGNEANDDRARSVAPRVIGAAIWLALAAFGFAALRRPEGTYLGLILAWAGPVLAILWAYAGAEIWARRRTFLAALAPTTLYLWIVDAVAIRLGIWHISEELSTGLKVLGLPIEEAIFFLVTNLLVVQGLIALVYPPGVAEARRAPAPAPAS